MKKLLVREIECFDTRAFFDFETDLPESCIIDGGKSFNSYNDELIQEINAHFEDIAYEYCNDKESYLAYYDTLTDYLNDYLPKQNGKYTDNDVNEMRKLFERYCSSNSWDNLNDNDFVAEILTILKGEKMYAYALQGYSQGDYVRCYYNVENSVFMRDIESYFFGLGIELEIVETDNCDIDFSTNIDDYYDRDMVDYIYLTESYDVIGQLEKEYDIDKNNIMFYEITGYKTIPVYKLCEVK